MANDGFNFTDEKQKESLQQTLTEEVPINFAAAVVSFENLHGFNSICTFQQFTDSQSITGATAVKFDIV